MIRLGHLGASSVYQENMQLRAALLRIRELAKTRGRKNPYHLCIQIEELAEKLLAEIRR
jgi:hypothetical protein